jgi:glycosyltransferase involved in cell wall biosynthesis
MAYYRLHLLSRDPWIGAAKSGGELRPAAEHLARLADGAAAHMLVIPSWHGPVHLPQIAKVISDMARSAPNLRFTVATATGEDDLLYRRAGLGAIWCNHNAFLDERLYAPDPGTDKRFDTVHIGRLVPFKRHELAVAAPRLAVISGDYEVEDSYALGLISAFEDLRFVNYVEEVGVLVLEQDQVRQVLTESRCGLALSAREGAMFASAEYLLSGLPVVTTPSEGGRDVFFHPDYVETVAPEAGAVAQGIARLLARNLDPQMIRDRTIALFKPHRARLITWLSGIAQQDLFALANETLWLPSFVNKLETEFWT